MTIFKYKDELGKNGEVVKRPIGDVYLKSNEGEWIEFHPYIDSGADVGLIPLSLGKLIGLSVDKRKIEQIGGISGSIPVVYHQIQMKIGSNQLSVKIGWALVEKVPPLLGRENVFDFFNVTFQQKKRIIIFERSK